MSEEKELDDKKKIEHTVVHPKRYMMVESKLQKLKVGATVEMTEKEAARHGKKFKKLVAAQSIEVGSKPAK